MRRSRTAAARTGYSRAAALWLYRRGFDMVWRMPGSLNAAFVRATPLTFALLWSSGFIVGKYAVADADPLTFLAARFAIAALLLAAVAAASRAPWPARGRETAHSMVAGMLLHGGYVGGVWWAINAGLPAGIAGLITAGQPLLTALLAAPLLGERLSIRQWVGILTGFAGIVLVLLPRVAGVDPALIATAIVPIAVNFGATVSVTLGTFYQKRFVPVSDLRTGTCLQYVGALAVVLPVAVLTEPMRFDPTASLLWTLAFAVLVLSIAAVGLLLMMIRRGEVSRVAALIYLVPPLTALEAWILFGETLTLVQIAGMAVAALGVWLATQRG
jgi:drug/metabolite transporter (DMT)-like permease